MRSKLAILAGCAVFFTGSICCASGITSTPADNSSSHRIAVPANLDHQQVRPWLNTIKPSAGSTKKTFVTERKRYWQHTVNRKRRRNLKE